MKKTNILWRVAILFICTAMLAACDKTEVGEDNDKDKSDNSEIENSTATAPDVPIHETMNWIVTNANGFEVSINIDDFSNLPTRHPDYFNCEHTEGVCISEYPFDSKDMFDNYIIPPYEEQIKTIDMGFTTIDGLLPGHTYYIRVWFELRNLSDNRIERICSNLIKIESPQASPFSNVRTIVSSIKDITLEASLISGIHADKAVGGYDVEFMESEMNATYRKVSPRYETWKDTDTEKEGLSVDGGLHIELHNLMPGQKVRIRPWIMIGDERFNGNWVEKKSASLATEGYVQIGGILWAANNVGANKPYEIGDLFDSPIDVPTEEGAEVPNYPAWEYIINPKENWVCGNLEGTDGWFFIHSTGTIFFPFTWKTEEGSSIGDYWGNDAVYLSPISIAYMFFRCYDDPGLINHQSYSKEWYDLPGVHPKPVRLIKHI